MSLMIGSLSKEKLKWDLCLALLKVFSLILITERTGCLNILD